MTKKVKQQAAEMSCLQRMSGLYPRRRVVPWKGLRIESLLLPTTRSQLRWNRYLPRMLRARLLGEVFGAWPIGRKPQGRPRTCWWGSVSGLPSGFLCLDISCSILGSKWLWLLSSYKSLQKIMFSWNYWKAFLWIILWIKAGNYVKEKYSVFIFTF